MLTIYADAETYYDKEYSLRKMTPIEYVRDPRFETIMWAAAVENDTPVIYEGEEFIDNLRRLQESYRLVSHNALFDATILAWRHDIHPTLLVDTMSMARALTHTSCHAEVSHWKA